MCGSSLGVVPSYVNIHTPPHCLSVLQTTSGASGLIQTITALGGHNYAISHLQVFGFTSIYVFFWELQGIPLLCRY